MHDVLEWPSLSVELHAARAVMREEERENARAGIPAGRLEELEAEMAAERAAAADG